MDEDNRSDRFNPWNYIFRTCTRVRHVYARAARKNIEPFIFEIDGCKIIYVTIFCNHNARL